MKHDDSRLAEAVELMVRISSGDLDARGETTNAGDHVDAIVAGLNMLAESLKGETEKREQAEALLAAAQRRTEMQLGETEERLKSVFTTSPDTLMMVDRKHQIQMVNRVIDQLDHDSVIGTPVYMYVPVEDHDRIRAHLDCVLEAGETQQWATTFELEGIAPVYFESSASPIVVGGKITGCVISSRDVTSRRALETERAQLQEQTRHSQKMEAIGRLAGGIAHDFNNILTAIMGHCSLGQLDLEVGDPRREWADEVQSAAQLAADLTKQLLAFSRRQVTEPKIFDMSALVTKLCPMLNRMIDEGIQLSTNTSSDWGVYLDPRQVEQVIINLVINARDAMPDGGEILVETRAVVLDAEICQSQPGASPGPHVMLAVSDTGTGMSAEVINRIFEPFFTTKAQGRGTGLGLATAFGIVEQAGGWIDVVSKVGLGSTFQVYFPAADGDILPLRDEVAEPVEGGDETVLLVEDDPMVRKLALGLLKSLGYEVLAAEDGMHALAVSEAFDGKIDILVTDVVMPNMNGRQLAEALTELRPEVQVLFTSGYPKDIITHQGVLNKGVRFLPKPYTLESLASHVRGLVTQD